MTRRTMLGAGAALTLLVGLLTGCSTASQPAPSPEPAPTVTVTATAAAPTPDSSVSVLEADSLVDFRDQLREQGLTCEGWEVVVEDVSGTCADATLITYGDDTAEGRELFQEGLHLTWTSMRDQERDDVGLLVGSNVWARMSAEAAAVMQERVGGVVLTG